ncbi:hypothetical protein BCR37DRAFT_381346 [Protomyces lactucae-debilis]|uniref:Mitochondrial distribution and morphology protein 34 n=1 Tax=Protomyces lactucae-debilis TaxID=2754530 RepID=A0A1Y2F9B5_PROLT|nr:uncharacterized protein BCR37DRAFT_381346 [Protomyces lactucae-debilis]ORY79926.1 hypothetical protein BCR37DRAFT_381346 [Protomyces lactucae-debilis]
MAFHFSWDNFSDAFVENAATLLTGALNKGSKPSIIADTITVKELNMGSKPPVLELIELCDLEADEFKGVFRMRYSGDAHIIMQTKVQANPLLNRPTTELPFSPIQMVAADAPLTVPMFLQLSDMELDGTVILLFTKAKGLSMVFRNDPLSKVLVTSTFDGIPVIRDFLQAQIEKKLRQLLCDELPAIIQQLSVAWSGRVPSPKVRATTLNFTVPPIEADLNYKSGMRRPVSRQQRFVQQSGYNASRSIPHLYRNQSFTGRGQLTPFTPAIAEAIYKSTSLSALDLAERKAKMSATASVTTSTSTLSSSPERRTVKKHSVIRLGKAAKPVEKPVTTPGGVSPAQVAQTTQTPVTVASYFDKDSPLSVDVKTPVKLQVINEDEQVLSMTGDKKHASGAITATDREQQQRRMEKKLSQKIVQERRQAGLENGMHRMALR